MRSTTHWHCTLWPDFGTMPLALPGHCQWPCGPVPARSSTDSAMLSPWFPTSPGPHAPKGPWKVSSIATKTSHDVIGCHIICAGRGSGLEAGNCPCFELSWQSRRVVLNNIYKQGCYAVARFLERVSTSSVSLSLPPQPKPSWVWPSLGWSTLSCRCGRGCGPVDHWHCRANRVSKSLAGVSSALSCCHPARRRTSMVSTAS